MSNFRSSAAYKLVIVLLGILCLYLYSTNARHVDHLYSISIQWYFTAQNEIEHLAKHMEDTLSGNGSDNEPAIENLVKEIQSSESVIVEISSFLIPINEQTEYIQSVLLNLESMIYNLEYVLDVLPLSESTRLVQELIEPMHTLSENMKVTSYWIGEDPYLEFEDQQIENINAAVKLINDIINEYTIDMD